MWPIWSRPIAPKVIAPSSVAPSGSVWSGPHTAVSASDHSATRSRHATFAVSSVSSWRAMAVAYARTRPPGHTRFRRQRVLAVATGLGRALPALRARLALRAGPRDVLGDSPRGF